MLYPAVNQVDRRVLRTRQLITLALFELIMEKPFSDIIVKDITERANINRSTFYSHYQDKYDLLNKTADEKLSQLNILLHEADRSYQPDFNTSDPYFTALFEHIAENQTFYRIILIHLSDTSLAQKLQEMIRDCCFKRLSHTEPVQHPPIPLDIFLDYISSAQIGIITKWLEQQTKYSPNYMALQLTRLSMLGTYKTMGYT